MENDLPQTHQRGRSRKTLLIVVIVLVLLFLTAGVYFYQTRKTAQYHVLGASNRKFNLSMLKLSPAPLTEKQKEQLAQGTSTSTKEKRFYVTGGNFYFTPNTITVNQGDMVKIVFNDINGMHDFVIDELHVRTPIVRAGQFAVASFTVEKKGSYEYYCSVPGHRQQGMKGTLVVE